jgi:hypothetical protein
MGTEAGKVHKQNFGGLISRSAFCRQFEAVAGHYKLVSRVKVTHLLAGLQNWVPTSSTESLTKQHTRPSRPLRTTARKKRSTLS